MYQNLRSTQMKKGGYPHKWQK